jgi:hypothetical protein
MSFKLVSHLDYVFRRLLLSSLCGEWFIVRPARSQEG